MSAFGIDPEILAARRERARERALSGEGPRLAADLGAGMLLDDDDLATLFLSDDVTSEDLLAIACEMKKSGAPKLETFSPLYISNECAYARNDRKPKSWHYIGNCLVRDHKATPRVPENVQKTQ